MSDDYDVVLLIEQPLSALDAQQVRSLHEELPETVRYHLLLPVDDAAVRVESAMGALGSPGDLLPTGLIQPELDVEELQDELVTQARKALQDSVTALQDAGAATVQGELVSVDPVDGLVAKVGELGAAEVIVMTSSHVVSEFFHLDWTSRARRKLGVPVLHLLEAETFDEQAEGYGEEGVTGL
ncbi:hypothetical protein D9V37_11630 [Nocardioides mangrovicus]|uniref:Universal stress protein n=1 Tax=Nocardioides mangrovicus TaxID=2478913 RepID=A0A3L8P3T3_9ACTN|nr:hypothetical protein [Nocardioides mangrovicus]RLV49199.1 hypothetical protein D9V37_11630 [Nocardioides mangrovicus]